MPAFGNLQNYKKLDTKFTYTDLKAFLTSDDKKNIHTMEIHTYTVQAGDININPVGSVQVTEYNFYFRKIGEHETMSYDAITGIVSINYHNTTITRLYPDGTVIFAPLLHYRYAETKKRLCYIARANGGDVFQKDYAWYITGKDANGEPVTVDYGFDRWELHTINNGVLGKTKENEIYKYLPTY